MSCGPSKSSPEPCHAPAKAWWRHPLFLVSALCGIGIALSYLWPVLIPLRHSLFHYTSEIWWAVGLGLLLGGIIHRYIPASYINKWLSGNHYSTILRAVGLGFLMSACSHGLLAIAMSLYKKGASTAAVVSFLLASPWANLPITLLFISLFGLKSIWLLSAAIIIAIGTGFVFLGLHKKGWIEQNPNTITIANNFSIRADIKKRWQQRKWTPTSLIDDFKEILSGAWDLALMVLWWVILGIFLASLSATLIPAHFFDDYMGPTLIGLFITLGTATVIEVCSEGSAPLAFELYRQTGAFGNSFVFLMAGVITDYTEIGLVWKTIGRKTAFWLVFITVPQALFVGWLMNQWL